MVDLLCQMLYLFHILSKIYETLCKVTGSIWLIAIGPNSGFI